MNFYQSVSSNKPVNVKRFLDLYTGSIAAYSLRRLRTSHTGSAVRVRRASDNTEQDIGFDADGHFHISALDDFCSGTNGFVTVWYDQSPYNHDLLQSDTTLQHLIYLNSSGVATTNNNNRASVGANQVNDPSNVAKFMSASFTESLADGYSYFGVTGPIGYNQNALGVSHAGSFGNNPTVTGFLLRAGTSEQGTHYHTNKNNYSPNQDSNGYPDFGQRIAGNSIIQNAHFDGESSSSLFVIRSDGYNNLATKTNQPDPTTPPSTIRLFNHPSKDYPYQEFLVFNEDVSSQRVEIETALNNYYGVGRLNYDLPLDTYTDVEVAYSVRKLRTAYTGSCMAVYNGTSSVDIGFNEFNELDVPAIKTHCGTHNGYVSTWYDQSGNANNATQTDWTKMPQIYDGSFVLMHNKKPVVTTVDNPSGSRMEFSPVLNLTSSHNFIAAQKPPFGQYGAIFAYGAYANENDSHYGAAGNGGGARVGTGLHINGTANSATQKNTFSSAIGSTMNLISSVQDYSRTSGKHFLGTDQTPRKYVMFNTQEVIIFSSDKTSDRVAIETNMNNYYNLF